MQEPSPGTAQPLSVCWCRGCLSNDKTPSLSWDMGAWPVLQPPFWALTNHNTEMWRLGEAHLCSVQGTLGLLHVNEERERRDSRFSQKSKNISSELPFKCDYTSKKQHSNGTRRLYILPVLIPICIVFNKEIKRLFCYLLWKLGPDHPFLNKSCACPRATWKVIRNQHWSHSPPLLQAFWSHLLTRADTSSAWLMVYTV